ncbi:MAG: excinuclease ABC subunit A, partial [Myxococcota bacterium]
MPDRKKFITIRGARQHNLKALDVRIPRGLLTVVTGPSGSGKSSLAFDTLYAEGQRRYVESFSAYARQFLERMDRPDVDSVDGVLPAVAIERKNSIRSSRSTVGTLTELADYFKLLFARGATLHCEDCGVPVQRDTAGSAADALIRDQAGQSITVTFPIVPNDVGGIEVADAWLRGRGWFRIADEEGTIRRLDRDGETIQGTGSEVLYVVQDRVVAQPDKRARLVEALEHALREGRGHARAFAPTGTRRFTSHLRCTDCARSYSLPSPALFSFNTPLGACEACNGFGRVIDVDIDRIIPDPALSLADGAIKPWTTPKTDWERERMAAWCALVGIDLDAPWASLSASDQSRVFDGEEATGWHGVRGWFRGLERKAYRMHIRVFLSRYRAYTACQDCHGARYSAATLLWRVGDLNLEDVGNQALEQAQAWHSALDLSTLQDQALDVVRREIGSRLGYLVDIGLGYLTLNRASRTLSGGELQRVNLTTALGSRLVDTLYVLDEPSVGLHPRDNHRLLGVLRGIRDLGNTVVVVEHDEAIIRAADHLIDLGPASGDAGGAIQYEGPPAGVTTADSATAIALRNPEIVPADRRAQGPWLTIYGARGNNLQSIDAAFALNALTCISGVSGSGKSTLVIDSLYRGLKRKRGETTEAPAPFDRIAG